MGKTETTALRRQVVPTIGLMGKKLPDCGLKLGEVFDGDLISQTCGLTDQDFNCVA